MTIILTFVLLFNLNNNPPGTIKVKNYFVDKTEIQNIHWLEYIYHKGQTLDSIEIQKLLPDSTNFWYSIPENRFKPIVLITYEQALDYCQWRSQVVSEKIGKKVTYRLPTKIEWKDIVEELIKYDVKHIEEEIKEAKQKIKKDTTQYTLIDREKPKARVYDLFDNVTEMTFEKGIAVGSNNYDLTDPQTNMTRLIRYNAPNIYLGFRCIAEIE